MVNEVNIQYSILQDSAEQIQKKFFSGGGCRAGESNTGLPYRSPTRYQLSYATP
jgi:hypothetical protein